jgi:hypothetical protein
MADAMAVAMAVAVAALVLARPPAARAAQEQAPEGAEPGKITQCDHALLTLDGRHLILAPGCVRTKVLDLRSGEVLPRGSKASRVRRQRALPIMSLATEGDVPEALRSHLTRDAGTSQQPRAYRTYRLPHTGWVVQFVTTLEGPDRRGRLRSVFAGRLRYGPYETFVADFHYRVGLDAHLGGDLERARLRYLQAIRADPLHPEAGYGLARVLARLDRRDEAVAVLATVIALWPKRHAEARDDSELEPLHADPRFVSLVAARDVFIDEEPFERVARPRPPVIPVAGPKMVRVHRHFERVGPDEFSYEPGELATLIPSMGDFMRHGDLRYDPAGRRWDRDGWVARGIGWRGMWNVLGFDRARFKVLGPTGADRGEAELQRIFEGLMAGERVVVRWVAMADDEADDGRRRRRRRKEIEAQELVLTPRRLEEEIPVKGPDNERIRALMR